MNWCLPYRGSKKKMLKEWLNSSWWLSNSAFAWSAPCPMCIWYTLWYGPELTLTPAVRKDLDEVAGWQLLPGQCPSVVPKGSLAAWFDVYENDVIHVLCSLHSSGPSLCHLFTSFGLHIPALKPALSPNLFQLFTFSSSPATSYTWTRIHRHTNHYLNLPFPPFFVGSSAYIPVVLPCVPATSEYYPLTSLPACVPAFLLVNPSACKPCFSSLKYLLWICLPLSLRLGPFCLCCFHQPWQNEGIAFAKMVFIPPLFMPRHTETTPEARGGPALLYIMLVSPLSPVSSIAVYIKVPHSLFHVISICIVF